MLNHSRVLMKLILRSMAFAAAWFFSVWLLADATGQALYLGSHGKEPGYYTEVELFLNLDAPTQWVRRTELGVGAVMFSGVLLAIIAQVIRWRRTSAALRLKPGE
jgi:hypothetical protein